MALLELKDITKTYQMGEVALQALDHISLQIDRKEFVAITGFSGSGKSTLMHVMGCLDTPTSGSYHIDGTDVSKMDTGALAQIRNTHIGFVFQRFYLLPLAFGYATLLIVTLALKTTPLLSGMKLQPFQL